MAPTLRLLVADDDANYRLLVRLALAAADDLEVMGEANTAAELIEQARPGAVDLVLLDRSLPGLIEALPPLREAAPDIRLVLTSSLPPARVADDVAAVGAVGSLAKDVPLRQLARAVRELGTMVGGAERALHSARRSLPLSLESVPASRRLARAALQPWCDTEVCETATLLISELVTNGVRHAGTDVDIRVAVGADHVRVEVADRSPQLPVPRRPQLTDPGGRGMGLVADLSLRWGVQARRTGKVVWFELPRAATVAAPP